MILVTGNGNLAKALQKHAIKDLPIVCLPRKVMDITNENEVFSVIKKYMLLPNFPKYLIHTAALTKPMSVNDRNPILSMSTNIVGTANVAKACERYGIKFIYISTDFVYNPNIPGGIANEESPLGPINKYGWSKLGGECVTQLIPNSLILRCALCDIPFRHTIAYEDVYRSSITHYDAAAKILESRDRTGVINIAGTYQSVYEFVSQHQKIRKDNSNNSIPSIGLDVRRLYEG